MIFIVAFDIYIILCVWRDFCIIWARPTFCNWFKKKVPALYWLKCIEKLDIEWIRFNLFLWQTLIFWVNIGRCISHAVNIFIFNMLPLYWCFLRLPNRICQQIQKMQRSSKVHERSPLQRFPFLFTLRSFSLMSEIGKLLEKIQRERIYLHLERQELIKDNNQDFVRVNY